MLDGRNRIVACTLLGIKPAYAEYVGSDPIQFVASQNLHRRHLTPSQKAFVAGNILAFFEKEAKERQREGGGDRKSEEYRKSVVTNLSQPIPENSKPTAAKSRDRAAALSGSSPTAVQQAEARQREAGEQRVDSKDPETGKFQVVPNLSQANDQPNQRAFVGARMLELFEKQAEERERAGKGADGSGGRGNKKNPGVNLRQGLEDSQERAPKSSNKAAALAGASPRAVENAKKVQEAGIPELQTAVQTNVIKVSEAAQIATLPPERQAEVYWVLLTVPVSVNTALKIQDFSPNDEFSILNIVLYAI